MRLVFLFPLALGLAIGAISQQLADEIAYLTGAFAVLNLLLSLILAPWQVQIILLIAAFFVVRYLWLKTQARTEEEEAQTNPGQKGNRQYRGVSYDDQSRTINLDPGQTVSRQYRGVSYEGPTATIPQKNLVPSGKASLLSRWALKYRGANLMSPPAAPSGQGSNAEAQQS
ncbi:DUF4278 domain-containing protein [Synechocystis sp. LKSZ1]|uniref:DUF4278 domain-containing protein n=1 Tax=Synechocystis sp. LKSZ1 TaxID=3144951 RepID=UPI00336C18EF